MLLLLFLLAYRARMHTMPTPSALRSILPGVSERMRKRRCFADSDVDAAMIKQERHLVENNRLCREFSISAQRSLMQSLHYPPPGPPPHHTPPAPHSDQPITPKSIMLNLFPGINPSVLELVYQGCGGNIERTIRHFVGVPKSLAHPQLIVRSPTTPSSVIAQTSGGHVAVNPHQCGGSASEHLTPKVSPMGGEYRNTTPMGTYGTTSGMQAGVVGGHLPLSVTTPTSIPYSPPHPLNTSTSSGQHGVGGIPSQAGQHRAGGIPVQDSRDLSSSMRCIQTNFPSRMNHPMMYDHSLGGVTYRQRMTSDSSPGGVQYKQQIGALFAKSPIDVNSKIVHNYSTLGGSHGIPGGSHGIMVTHRGLPHSSTSSPTSPGASHLHRRTPNSSPEEMYHASVTGRNVRMQHSPDRYSAVSTSKLVPFRPGFDTGNTSSLATSASSSPNSESSCDDPRSPSTLWKSVDKSLDKSPVQINSLRTVRGVNLTAKLPFKFSVDALLAK